VLEVFSVFSFNSPFGGEPWSVRSDYKSGDLGFDPLGLKPTSAAEYSEMATKEINNGRLAMIAVHTPVSDASTPSSNANTPVSDATTPFVRAGGVRL